MDEQQTVPFDPDKIKQTKTYSISMGDVARVKEMGAWQGESDAEILHRAIMLLYGQVTTVSEKVSR